MSPVLTTLLAMPILVAWGAGEPGSPRTMVGGFGSPLRAPTSAISAAAWADDAAARSPLADHSPNYTSADSPGAAWPHFTWLGYPRRVPRAWSASRDTPAMNMILFPRPAHMAGGDFSLFTLEFKRWSLRSGFAGFLELEVDARTSGTNAGGITSGGGKILWRGSYSYFAAFSLDALARSMCQGCAIELALQYRHESQHYTGSNTGNVGEEDATPEPFVGDDLIVDLASLQRNSNWLFAERAIGMWFLPDRSSYSAGVGLDLHARFVRFEAIQPFISAYAEHLTGDVLQGRQFPDAYRVRALVGIALPSSLGEILIYGAGDVGHRYGIRGLTEEATLGLGIRLALASGPKARPVSASPPPVRERP